MWSFVQNKENQRWLWLAVDHSTRRILARRKDKVFKKLKALLEPFGVGMFYSDDWGSYERIINPENHTISKMNTINMGVWRLKFFLFIIVFGTD